MNKLFLALFLGSVAHASEISTCKDIQAAIDSADDSGQTIRLQAQTYECESPIVLDKNNLKLIGAGQKKTFIVPAQGKYLPLVIIGSTTTTVQQVGPQSWKPLVVKRVKNILLQDLTVDGQINLEEKHDHVECYNPEKGTNSDCADDSQSVRTNGITIRGATNVTVKNVHSRRNVSGGLVTEKFCKQLKLDHFTSTENYFDGFAGYETEQSMFTNLNLSHNRGAGVSIDIDFSNNTMKDVKMIGNRDAGIFMRNLKGNKFINFTIKDIGGFGVFLAADFGSDGPDVAKCAVDNLFKNFNVDGAVGEAIRINSPCKGNVVENLSAKNMKPKQWGSDTLRGCVGGPDLSVVKVIGKQSCQP